VGRVDLKTFKTERSDTHTD